MSSTSILVLILAILAIIGGAIFTRQGRGVLGIALIVLGVIVGVYAVGLS